MQRASKLDLYSFDRAVFCKKYSWSQQWSGIWPHTSGRPTCFQLVTQTHAHIVGVGGVVWFATHRHWMCTYGRVKCIHYFVWFTIQITRAHFKPERNFMIILIHDLTDIIYPDYATDKLIPYHSGCKKVQKELLVLVSTPFCTWYHNQATKNSISSLSTFDNCSIPAHTILAWFTIGYVCQWYLMVLGYVWAFWTTLREYPGQAMHCMILSQTHTVTLYDTRVRCFWSTTQ